jgi:hypothetical protein
LLPRQPPRCFSTGRAHGVRPTELDLTGIASASRRCFPSCDWRIRAAGIARSSRVVAGIHLPG